jgi:hypothetical protein
MVRSVLVEAMMVPSGLNATPKTLSVWPVRGWPMGLPVAASHRRTVWSALAEAMTSPSGLNATPKTWSVLLMIATTL